MNSSGGTDETARPVSGEGPAYQVDPLTSPGAPGWQVPPPISPMPPLLPEQSYGPIGYPPPPAAPPRRSGFSAFWNHPGVIAGIMGTLVLLVTALSIVAITALRSNSTSSTGGGNPGVTNAAGGPSQAQQSRPTPGATTKAPDAATNSPAAKATTAGPDATTFLSGQMNLTYHSYGADAADFDSAAFGGTYAFKEGQKPDVAINSTSLDAKNRAGLHKWTGAGEPDQAGCANGAQWAPSMHVSTLAPDTVICFQTSEGRVGAVTLTDVKKDGAGQLDSVEFTYVVWKKQGDQ